MFPVSLVTHVPGRTTGGSSLRFCNETRDWPALPADERGVPHTAICGCAVDEFNYGIHAYAHLAGLLGAGALAVRHLGRSHQRTVQIRWEDLRLGIVMVGKLAAWAPFHAAAVAERGAAQFTPAANQEWLPRLAGFLEPRDGTHRLPTPMPIGLGSRE